MTIEYKDSKRIVGTNADRIGVSAVSGGWVELARTTLGADGDNIDITSLPDKRYYMYLLDRDTSGSSSSQMSFNNDSGSNYATRYASNGTEYTATSQSYVSQHTSASQNSFAFGYIANKSDKEKLISSWVVGDSGSGASNAPSRYEQYWKWVNTSSVISRVDIHNHLGGDLASGSELVVLGWDPADTHTTNFWEELASVELGSAGTNLSSGTISAKKYLWIQAFTKSSSGSIALNMTFNNDTGSNYAQRRSIDGSSDSTNTSRANIQLQADTAADVKFNNIFIINNSSNEKLVIHNSAESQASGAGTVPVRRETVGKWANTSSQITEIDIDNGLSGNYDTGSFIKVWGSN